VWRLISTNGDDGVYGSRLGFQGCQGEGAMVTTSSGESSSYRSFGGGGGEAPAVGARHDSAAGASPQPQAVGQRQVGL
jgi:hypothetical protein